MAARHNGPDLAGLNVVLPRTPDRASAMVRELQDCGASVTLMPLIDFQFPADTALLDRALNSLKAGRFAWVVFTSVTTVRAVTRRCAALGICPEALVPADTRIAAVGAGTRQALEEVGFDIDFLPDTDQSARGLAASWPDPSGSDPEGGDLRVLLPQADVADPSLHEALTALGWEVRAVTAYCTVDYPATGVRFTPAVTGGGLLDPESFAAWAPAGRRAVVLTSPSIARRFVRRCVPVPAGTLLVAIGDSTAARMRELGAAPDAVAKQPTPAGIAHALSVAMSTGPTP
ncbi:MULTISPECIES: uroporphyrinogen-III synthase [unclassified Arthrobacter]|uniref:uroporphyrinogen-III synthase n=1 Tax=unclassified Arthrobacter TaxID=235627 RepID=UPI001D153805|nr:MULTISPECIES: uroporphyrinogen-III synthase [unclassified Arthrobacter]MCC3290416.1 uroporphyrinogen-III synthase [Arthrobacter sp. zg-Y1110]MCC3300071.1 uroporphyrinogen-III synthase [Arthrobacter sp. zg-Y895]UWX84213.1 uroporphyrinogen-III synthase [Arthrobacter sp. zg-Y1110]